MTPTNRLYSHYQTKVLKIVYDVLKQRNICFDITQPGKKIESKTNNLLVVWSEDFLSSRQNSERNVEQARQAFINQLSTRNRPVLWLTAVDHAGLDFNGIGDNIRFLHYGGDIMLQMKEYPLVAPQRKKTLDLKFSYQWISLNHSTPVHRILAACILLGHNLGDQTSLQNRGLLRISPHNTVGYDSLRGYVRDHAVDIKPWTESQDQVLQTGFTKLKQSLNGGQPAGNIYENLRGNDNAANFNRSLRFLYQHSMIEIVNETTFFSKGIFITEKFLNSVYGFNLPIILSNCNTVAYLREHGFDMFDDVIDHSYDAIEDPIDRIFAAIEKNLKLLTDFNYSKCCYQRCMLRLEHNYQYARLGMYDYFLNDFRQNLQDYLDSSYINITKSVNNTLTDVIKY